MKIRTFFSTELLGTKVKSQRLKLNLSVCEISDYMRQHFTKLIGVDDSDYYDNERIKKIEDGMTLDLEDYANEYLAIWLYGEDEITKEKTEELLGTFGFEITESYIRTEV